MAEQVFANVFGLYVRVRFYYGPEEVGIVVMVLGLASVLTQGLLAGSVTKRWGDERSRRYAVPDHLQNCRTRSYSPGARCPGCLSLNDITGGTGHY